MDTITQQKFDDISNNPLFDSFTINRASGRPWIVNFRDQRVVDKDGRNIYALGLIKDLNYHDTTKPFCSVTMSDRRVIAATSKALVIEKAYEFMQVYEREIVAKLLIK